MIESFHFLRPAWLLLLAPLLLVIWLWLRAGYDSGSWRAVIDERLLPHVLSGGGSNRRRLAGWIYALVGLCAIVALAGPTREKLPQPVYQRDASMVIALDLSRSMNATDIKPSRLARARHKIADILNLRLEGQSALVVYAADAFTVTPLTSDADTILALLPGLDSELMPAQGSRADRALGLAFDLFENAGVQSGDVLLVSDGLSARELEQAQQLHRQKPAHRLSVLAIGTPEGGPVPLSNGGFLKHRDGSIVITGLREDNLRRLAQSGDGVFATISSDDLDINTIAYLFEAGLDTRAARASDHSADLWRELGPGLLLLCLPFAALAFRRGAMLGISLVLLLSPPAADAFDWNGLWQNPDQRARAQFDAGEHAAAAELFADPGWRAASRYRAGDYAAALETWQQQTHDDALYNRGNALARLGRFPDALAAYEKLLQRNPAHEDARFNKQAIEDWLRRQQQQQQQQQQSQQQQQQQGQDSSQPQQNQAQQSQSAGDRSQTPPANEGQDQAQPQPRATSDPESGEGDEAQARAGGDGAADTAREASRESSAEDELARRDRQMTAQAAEQWLRKIPDDPGGLLRRKFLYQYRKRGGVDAEAQSW